MKWKLLISTTERVNEKWNNWWKRGLIEAYSIVFHQDIIFPGFVSTNHWLGNNDNCVWFMIINILLWSIFSLNVAFSLQIYTFVQNQECKSFRIKSFSICNFAFNISFERTDTNSSILYMNMRDPSKLDCSSEMPRAMS